MTESNRPPVMQRTRRTKLVKKLVRKVPKAAPVDEPVDDVEIVEAETPEAEATPRRVAKVAKTKAAAPATKAAKKATKSQFKEQWSGPENIRAQTSGVLKGLMDEAAKEFGDPDICTAGEAGRLVVGLRLPSFALEYMFQNTVLPLGRVIQLLGVEGTCKSGFACEIARWFIQKYGGVASLKEHESKYSPDWAMSIIGWDAGDNFGHQPCDSVDAWQKMQLWTLNKIKKHMLGTEGNKGPGMVYPVLSIVDSIMGKATMDSQNRIDAAGSAGRDFPIEAQSITKYMRHIPQKIRQWPFVIVLVNHEKPHKDAQGKTVRDKAGGRGKEFQETFEISMSRVKKLSTREYDGLALEMRLYKNSLGVTDRRIPITVRWWDEPNPDDPQGPWRQKTVWDWHGATIELLFKMMQSKTSDKTKVREVIDLQLLTGKKVTSKRLGITKENPLDFYEAGLLLSENEQVLNDLRRVFGVKSRKEFEVGVDYRKQLGDEKRKIGKKIAYK